MAADPWSQFAEVKDDDLAHTGVPDGYVEQDPWSQFTPLPDGAQTDPAPGAPLPEAEYRQQLYGLIKAGKPKADIEGFMRSQGIDPAQVQGLDEAIAAVKQGRDIGVHVRDGETSANAAGETAGQAFYRGAGDIVGGIASIPGALADPLGSGMNWVSEKLGFGRPFSEHNAEDLRRLTGAPEPVTDLERLTSAINTGGAAALGTFGAGTLASGAGGMSGYVGRQLAEAPVANAVAGVAGGAGNEVGGDVGERVAGRGGRVAGSIIGGLGAGVAGFAGSRAVAARLARNVPVEAMIAPGGGLTDDGRELAARFGTTERDITQEYARARQSRAATARPVAERRAAREAVRGREAALDTVQPDRYNPQYPDAPAIDVPITGGQPTAEASQRFPDLNEQTNRIEGAIGDRLRNGEAFDGPAAPPPPPRDVFTEANEEGIRLTRGQAEQDFDVQNDENSLRVSTSKAGEQARGFFRQQQEQITGAVARFQRAFGSDPGTAADRGELLQSAIRDLRDSGAEGVRQLYDRAKALGGDDLELGTDGIRGAVDDVLMDELVPETVKRELSRELARYGIVGTAEPANAVGITTATLDDGSTIRFRGPTKQLTAGNAEDLRKSINRLYDSDPSRASQSIKPAIDDALEEALTRGSAAEGAIGDAYGAARAAHREQRRTFSGKDIVQKLIDSRTNGDTFSLSGERAIAQTMGAGKEGITNLRKVKALLLSSGQPQARHAWAAIQHQALADIFDAATIRNAGGELDAISGAKLRTAIFGKFGAEKLRTLLGHDEFARLMKLQRVIGAATIPINGTTNPSGTATKLINYMRGGVLNFAGTGAGIASGGNPVVTVGAHVLGGLVAKARDLAVTQKTLRGITSYEGRASSERFDREARAFMADYIRLGKSGELLPSSINVSAASAARTDRGTVKDR
jgi:hypothetical protein